MPSATCRALDRLGRPEVGSAAVAFHLAQWRQVAGMTVRELAGAHSDWTTYIGPHARDQLEAALCALPAGATRELRALVESIDERYRAKTSPNPRADATAAWWHRRWSPG